MPRGNGAVRLVVAALALWLASPAAQACSPFPLRNGTLELDGPGTFESRNGEFSIELPFERQRVEFGSFEMDCFYAINIDALDGNGHFSIEWVELAAPQTDRAFLEYWGSFLGDYLHRNFGNGSYELVSKEKFVDAQGRGALRYVGTGTSNGGVAGSIIGIATNFGDRMANVYTIFPRVDGEGEALLESAEARAVLELAKSLTCGESVCKQVEAAGGTDTGTVSDTDTDGNAQPPGG